MEQGQVRQLDDYSDDVRKFWRWILEVGCPWCRVGGCSIVLSLQKNWRCQFFVSFGDGEDSSD